MKHKSDRIVTSRPILPITSSTSHLRIIESYRDISYLPLSNSPKQKRTTPILYRPLDPNIIDTDDSPEDINTSQQEEKESLLFGKLYKARPREEVERARRKRNRMKLRETRWDLRALESRMEVSLNRLVLRNDDRGCLFFIWVSFRNAMKVEGVIQL